MSDSRFNFALLAAKLRAYRASQNIKEDDESWENFYRWRRELERLERNEGALSSNQIAIAQKLVSFLRRTLNSPDSYTPDQGAEELDADLRALDEHLHDYPVLVDSLPLEELPSPPQDTDTLEVVFAPDLTDEQKAGFLEVLGDLFEEAGGKGGLKIVGRQEVHDHAQEYAS